VQFFPNLVDADTDPAQWARDREAEGWPGIRASDHLWLVKPCPHVWVALTQMAMATTRIELGSSFANNLFRSPVEFVQASLSLQRASNGRFEAGLGAGWAASEMERTGRTFPDGPTRASMYREAVHIVRELFDVGRCTFSGEHYAVDINRIGPECPTPPPLAVSVGGPRTIREVAPLADRVEVKANGRATRGGRIDMAAVASLTQYDLKDLVERVREVNSHAPIGFYAMVAAGRGSEISQLSDAFGGHQGLFGRLMGEPQQVAETLLNLEPLGITRVQLTEFNAGSFAALAPYLASET
jgi:alkanesulfonate monooxygenase SsuD/methylene tetrahydromethanopterin reductase-like flavin-dependent oxidoreductase (luciferase family)